MWGKLGRGVEVSWRVLRRWAAYGRVGELKKEAVLRWTGGGQGYSGTGQSGAVREDSTEKVRVPRNESNPSPRKECAQKTAEGRSG